MKVQSCILILVVAFCFPVLADPIHNAVLDNDIIGVQFLIAENPMCVLTENEEGRRALELATTPEMLQILNDAELDARRRQASLVPHMPQIHEILDGMFTILEHSNAALVDVVTFLNGFLNDLRRTPGNQLAVVIEQRVQAAREISANYFGTNPPALAPDDEAAAFTELRAHNVDGHLLNFVVLALRNEIRVSAVTLGAGLTLALGYGLDASIGVATRVATGKRTLYCGMRWSRWWGLVGAKLQAGFMHRNATTGSDADWNNHNCGMGPCFIPGFEIFTSAALSLIGWVGNIGVNVFECRLQHRHSHTTCLTLPGRNFAPVLAGMNINPEGMYDPRLLVRQNSRIEMSDDVITEEGQPSTHCPICGSKFAAGQLKLSNTCKDESGRVSHHGPFCEGCHRVWNDVHHDCPICRRPVTSIALEIHGRSESKHNSNND